MRIVLYATILLLTSSLTAQTIIPLEQSNGSNQFGFPKVYFKDVNGVLNKFIGTWKWKSNADRPQSEYNLIISKEIQIDRSINFADELTGKSCYIGNYSNIVFSTMNENRRYIRGMSLDPHNTSKIRLMYMEPKPGPEVSRFVDGSTVLLEHQIVDEVEQLQFTLRFFPTLDESIPFIVPLSMTLIKYN